jgi:demethoxyubiquinone hydroxylase (CLK1/Coq7/Cat5 family)
MKKITLRGKLIKTIVNDFIKNHLFEHVNILNELQEELDKHLKFEVHVDNIEHINGSTSGLIYFKPNESKSTKVINVIVSNT